MMEVEEWNGRDNEKKVERTNPMNKD